MNTRCAALFAFCLALLAPAPALALDWKTQHLLIKAAPLQHTADTAFEFTNSGAQPVTILGVETSCDCLEAAPSAQIIAPGASGRITAKFHFGDRHGVYERIITVATDEAPRPVVLRVQLDVPEPASLTPRVLEWKLRGPADAQTIEIAIAPDIELSITGVQPTSEVFTARLETVEPGRRYRLYVAPQHTRAAASAAFRLHATSPTGQPLVLSAYGNVR